MNNNSQEIFAILDRIADGVLALDKAWFVTYANEAAQKTIQNLSMTSEPIVGKKFWNFFPNAMGTPLYKELERTMAEGKSCIFEEFFESTNEWFDFFAYPGKQGLTVYFQEVSERKRIVRAMVESEVRYRILAETSSDAIITIDEEGVILFVNQGAGTMFGYTSQEMLGQPLQMIIPPELRERHAKGFERYLTSGLKEISWNSMEFPGLHKDSHHIPLEISFSESTQNGKPVFTGILRDITERKKAEEVLKKEEQLLRESLEKYQLLFETNPEIMLFYDAETLQILAANQAAIKTYGYTHEELLTLTIKEIRPPEDIPKMQEYLKTISKGLFSAGIWRHRRKNGEIIWVDIIGERLEFSGRPAHLIVVKEVTAIVNVNQELMPDIRVR